MHPLQTKDEFKKCMTQCAAKLFIHIDWINDDSHLFNFMPMENCFESMETMLTHPAAKNHLFLQLRPAKIPTHETSLYWAWA